jgi:hypothetical protein
VNSLTSVISNSGMWWGNPVTLAPLGQARVPAGCQTNSIGFHPFTPPKMHQPHPTFLGRARRRNF